MKILIRTNSSSEYDNGNIDYGYVDLTDELVKTILKRGVQAKRLSALDASFSTLGYSDEDCSFFSIDDYAINGEQEKSLDDKDYAIVADMEDLGIPRRVDGNQMILTDEAVFWMCFPKQGEATICTEVLKLNFIETLLGVEKKPDGN